MVLPRRFRAVALVLLAAFPVCTLSRHILLDQVLSDKPPPGQSDAACAHLVRAGLDEGVDKKGRPIVEPEVHHLAKAMRKNWWECAAAVANALAKYGSEVEDAFQLEQRSITKSLNGIKSALERGKPVQSISPAFEWAQSGDWVYVNLKMSHKLDAPATLNVVSEGMSMQTRSIDFAASKDQKRFALSLALHADIDPDPSTVSFGSVGRVTFTLKKAKSGVKWPRLLDEEQKKPVNMHVWWSKQEEFADELDGLEEAAAEAASASSASAKTAGTDDDDEDAAAAAAAAAAVAADSASGATPMSSERRLAKAKKDAATSFSKEKKARVEELEKERRAVIKTIDADAAAKKKQAEDAHTARKTTVDEDFDELVKKRHADIVKAHNEAEANRSEL